VLRRRLVFDCVTKFFPLETDDNVLLLPKIHLAIKPLSGLTL